MDSEKQLKRLRGTCRLLNDIGVLAACPRLGKALADAEEELKQQVEEESPKSTVEEGLRLLVESGWTVQVSIEHEDMCVATATKDGKSHMAVGDTLSWVLESLAKKMMPLTWAKVQTEKK